MLVTIPILAIVCSMALWGVLGRPRFLRRRGEVGKLSIIIPARDEERNIGALLKSLDAPEVIVVDDGSTDRTAEIAKELGAKVVESANLPEGWRGKPWACQQGAEVARGDWLLFLDADTRLEPNGLEKIAALSKQAGGVFSICPYHQIERPYEELSSFFNVLMLAGVNAFGFSENAALFGQSFLISKKHYEQVGGHEVVRREILENFQLAWHLAQLGIQRRCYLGKKTITMRMFPGGFPDLWSSWKKGFVSGAVGAPKSALILSSLWITGGMFAMIGLLLLPWLSGVGQLLTAFAYLWFAAQCLYAFRLAGNFSILNALFFPISLMFYQWLFFTALIEKKRGIRTNWKGRDVD